MVHVDALRMLAAVAADPADATARLALTDALREAGCSEEVALEAHGPLPFSWWLNEPRFFGGVGVGSGRGSGSGLGGGLGGGSGTGSGRGTGTGSGRGTGSGSGSGTGSGLGGGVGSGRGTGSGIGSGIGSGAGSGGGRGSGSDGAHQMEVGKAYLIHCGDWHTIVGRVVRQVGPFTYLMDAVSKVHATNNGDNWEALAAGDRAARRAAEYRHYKVQAAVPLNIVAFEWLGPLPQEEGF